MQKLNILCVLQNVYMNKKEAIVDADQCLQTSRTETQNEVTQTGEGGRENSQSDGGKDKGTCQWFHASIGLKFRKIHAIFSNVCSISLKLPYRIHLVLPSDGVRSGAT